MDSQNYHVPVMAHEILELLIHRKDGIYFDGTLGGGGHAELILKKLSGKAKYIAVDRDPEALKNAGKRLADFKNFSVYQETFNNIKSVLKKENVELIDGALLDLGVSSWQIDQDARGFAFRAGNELDMRMNPEQGLTAKDIVNSYSQQDLKTLFKEYGEEKNSGRIAYKIVRARTNRTLSRSDELIAIIDECVDPRFAVKSYARIFQALRIAVNDELNILKDGLMHINDVLAKDGLLLVLSYHSLEDRIVKNFMREMENPCICPPELPVCVCGKKQQLKRMKPNFFVPSDSEIKQNVRARSAKLRVAIKV